VISGTVVEWWVEEMEGNRGDGLELKRLPLNVIQPSKRCCINKEKRRRSRKDGKSGERVVVEFLPIHLRCRRVYIYIYEDVLCWIVHISNDEACAQP